MPPCMATEHGDWQGTSPAQGVQVWAGCRCCPITQEPLNPLQVLAGGSSSPWGLSPPWG